MKEEREGKTRFSFFSLEERKKCLVKTEIREASTHVVGNKKQEKMAIEKKNLYKTI